MNAESCELVSTLILRKLGLSVTGEVVAGEMTISPLGYSRAESFVVHFQPAWRSADAALIPGAFAGSMVRSMGEADEGNKILFAGYAIALQKAGVHVVMSVNGSNVDAVKPNHWPSDWTTFEISLRKTALVFDRNKDSELLPVADLLVTPLLGMAIALIGTESNEAFEGESEGAAVQYLATRYERKKINRDACIRIHGSACAGCGFSFGSFYGELAEGYIEVHHIEPLAMSGVVQINPATDLVPLCSNCHSVVHRVNPPLAIEELRRLAQDGRRRCFAA